MSAKFASLLIVLLLAACTSAPTKNKEELQPEQPAAETSETEATTETADPGDADKKLQSAYSMGIGLMKSGDYANAAKMWTNLANSYPDAPGIWANLAVCQYHSGQFEDSQASLAKAREINPGFCPAFSIEALIAREMGKFTDAEAAYRNALKCQPTNPDIYRNLGILYDLYMRKYDLAVKNYKLARIYSRKDVDPNLDIWINDLEKRYGLAEPAQPAPATTDATKTDAAAETPATPAAATTTEATE